MKNLYRPNRRRGQEVKKKKRPRDLPSRSAGEYGALVLLTATVLAGSFGMATFGVRWLPGAVMSRLVFPLEQVRISGNAHLTEDQVLAAAGLKFGQNLFEIDLDEIRARLMVHPLVRSATVRRRLPSEVAVEIVERTPAAVVLNGKRYVVDANGFVMALPREGSTVLPCLKGLAVEGRRIVKEDLEDLSDGMEIIAAIKSTGFPKLSSIECIDLSRSNDAVLIPRSGTPLVHVGRRNVADRLEKWKSVARDMAGQWRKIEYVDLRAEGMVVAKPMPLDDESDDGKGDG